MTDPATIDPDRLLAAADAEHGIIEAGVRAVGPTRDDWWILLLWSPATGWVLDRYCFTKRESVEAHKLLMGRYRIARIVHIPGEFGLVEARSVS